MGWLVIGFSMVCMGSCGMPAPTAPKNVALGQDFELAPTQMATVGDTGLTVGFERVASDSRCPTDVVCIWEGDAAALVTAVQPPRETARLQLHTSGQLGPREARYGDFTIALVTLRPQPRSTGPIEPTAYRLTLRVSR